MVREVVILSPPPSRALSSIAVAVVGFRIAIVLEHVHGSSRGRLRNER